MKRTPLAERLLPDYTKGEEIFNMTSHIVGGAFGLVALILCVAFSCWNHDVWAIISGSIYGVTLILLYTMSSIYHGLKPSRAKKVFQVIDHCSIFLLIAGTYTPILLNDFRVVYPKLAWTLFGVIWGMALIGIVLNAIDVNRFLKVSMACYLGMGWCVVIAGKPMFAVLAPEGIRLLIIGGVVYTIGAVFYGIGKKQRYMHSIFHLFVLAGSILHFFFILLYVL